MMKLESLLTFLLVSVTGRAIAKEFMRVCYFASWANVRPSASARFDIEQTDPKLCTHLIYAFGKIDLESKLLVAGEPLKEDSHKGFIGRYQKFNNLKKSNSRLKTLLSIGGQNDLGEGFKAVTENDVILTRFATSAVDFLRKRDFDGLDIDWEYPNKSTKRKFTDLLKALRGAFDAEGRSDRLILTIAGPAGKWDIDPGYNIPSIARYVDFVNLMTYDYTVKTSKVAAFNSPLFSRNNIRFNEALSVNYTVHYWNTRGLPFNKMFVGFTGVGRRLVLENPNNTEVGAPVTGAVRTSDFYRIEAGLTYPEICVILSGTNFKKYFDEEQKCPYLVRGDDWVGYEDKQSLTIKIKWMMRLGVAGFMFWSLDQDDFSGKWCDDGKYPLLNAALSAIGDETEPELTENVNKDIDYISKKEPDDGNGAARLSQQNNVVLGLTLVLCLFTLVTRWRLFPLLATTLPLVT